MLRTGAEQNYYSGELNDIVLDALEDAISRVQPDGRRQHVLSAVLGATPKKNALKERLDELKTTFRGYKNMDRRTRHLLEAFGFSIQDDGKHYKLIGSSWKKVGKRDGMMSM